MRPLACGVGAGGTAPQLLRRSNRAARKFAPTSRDIEATPIVVCFSVSGRIISGGNAFPLTFYRSARSAGRGTASIG